jgi:transcription elongation factor GreA
MTTFSNDVLWLTQAAYDRLESELTELNGLTGNARVQAEGRIIELRRTLRNADVSDKPDDGLVEPGMKVVVQLDDETDPTTFLLAQRQLASVDLALEVDVYSPTSPLGEAIIGKYAGDEFHYIAPNGASIRGRVVSAEPFRG